MQELFYDIKNHLNVNLDQSDNILSKMATT